MVAQEVHADAVFGLDRDFAIMGFALRAGVGQAVGARGAHVQQAGATLPTMAPAPGTALA